MRRKNLEFPYPVLRQECDDYLGCSFAFKIDGADVKDKALEIEAHYDLQCNSLKKLISNGEAEVIGRFLCSKTSYRKTETLSSGKNKISIQQSEIADELFISVQIVSNTKIEAFLLPEFNPQYFRDIAFSIRKGDILAEEPGTTIKFGLELEKPLFSIFSIGCDAEIQQLQVKYKLNGGEDDGKIHIILPEDEYYIYNKLRNEYGKYGIRRFLQASIILPALVGGIELIRTEHLLEDCHPEEQYSDTLWGETVMRCCEKMDRDIDESSFSAHQIANELLGNVTKEGLSDLFDKMKEWHSGGEETRMGVID